MPISKGSGFGSEFPDGQSDGFGSEFPDSGPPAARPVAKPRPAVTRPPVKKAPPPAAVKKAAPPAGAKGKAPPAGASAGEPLKYKFNMEDAQPMWEELVPAEIQVKLVDPNWKAKLEGTEEMTKWLEDGAVETAESEVLFRFWTKVPGWGEKNFQVSQTSSRPSNRPGSER